jgi:DNA-binding phage protein
MTDTNDTNDNIQFDQDKIAALQPWKASDYLNTDEDIAAYLTEMLDPEDMPADKYLEALRSAIGDVIEALQKRKA